MKIAKLIFGVAAIATVISTSIAIPANAQRIRGVRYSQSNNVPGLDFDLVFRTLDGQDILDSDLASNTGFFTGAVEEFAYFGSQANFGFPVGNLSTRLTGDIVTYTLLSQNSFAIEDVFGNTTNVNQGPVFTFNFDVSGVNQAIRQRYINDLKFIVENKPYSVARSSSLVADTLGIDFDPPSNEDGSNPLAISEIPDTSIPEPNTIAALLAFGIFGLSSYLKRKAV